MTPNAKKSLTKLWFCLQITYGDMYPGVPLVSEELFDLNVLAIPKSVILIYPLESSTKF
jgi:hypothetical protein